MKHLKYSEEQSLELMRTAVKVAVKCRDEFYETHSQGREANGIVVRPGPSFLQEIFVV